jgi:hypothetical protein
MPTNIVLLLHRNSAVQKNAGNVSAFPALEPVGRLYVIHNATTSRRAYIGTAGNLQQRFTDRIAAIREWGFNNAAILPITIHAYRVTVDGHARQPNNLGFAGGIDVEHLLIRLHLTQGIPIRNYNKVFPYNNTSPNTINLQLMGAGGNAVPAYLGGAVINVAIPAGAAF